MAFDPVQKLCAIGAARGCVRLLGQAGVEHFLQHGSDEPVTHIQFLVNEVFLNFKLKLQKNFLGRVNYSFG